MAAKDLDQKLWFPIGLSTITVSTGGEVTRNVAETTKWWYSNNRWVEYCSCFF